MRHKQNGKQDVRGATNLFGEGLAVVSCAAEDNVAIEVDGVTNCDDAEHVDRPLQ
jgi:hypothetical protein